MTTIRGRLLVLLLTGLAAALIAGGTAVFWIAKASLVRQLDATLEARAQTLTSLLAYEPQGLKFDSGDAADMLGETHFELRTQSGTLLTRSDSLDEASLPSREALEHESVFDDVELPEDASGRAVWRTLRPAVEDEAESEEEDEGEDWLMLAPPGDPEVLIAAAAIDRGPVDRALATLLGALLLVGGVVGITVGVLVAVGVRWGLVPLDRLRAQLASVGDRTISKRFDDSGAARELLPVYRELNRMLDRVELTLVRKRSFVNAAAHELRTPLAELRTTAEVATRWPDPERAMAALREMLAIGREMERLVESLLLISRGRATAGEGVADAVPVASIVHDCLARATESISDKRLDLAVDLDDKDTLPAPRDAVEIIVRNLIDNAVRYTSSHGSITISDGQSVHGSPVLIVENGPVGLDEADLPRLFEPFWRADGSHSDRDHVGLGLTVVHRIAHAIGLSVDAGLTGDRLRIRVFAAA